MILKKLAKKLIYALWVINGYVGIRFHLGAPPKVTVLIAYYNPARMKHINHQIRNFLKCSFVERIIISNHNPDIKIDTLVKVEHESLVILNQKIRRGSGYRWLVANEFSPEYLIVVDDLLIFPWQLKKLFKSLVTEPEIPHGLAGLIRQKNGLFENHRKVNRSVDYLCEIYAITGNHLKRYIELSSEVSKNAALSKMVEFCADFIIISHTGSLPPQIHDAGFLMRCSTFNKAGVAAHKEPEFHKNILAVGLALNNIKCKNLTTFG
jgi:hypothetical protein